MDYVRNRVYVTSHSDDATATQPSLWVINSLTGALVGSVALGHIDGSPTLSYDGTRIYVNGTTGTTSTLYGVDADTLTVTWNFPLPAADVVVKGFVVEDWPNEHRLYFSTSKGCPVTNGDCVWAVQEGSATPLWRTEVTGASAPLQLGALYVGSSDGRLHQLDLATGADSKQFPTSQEPSTTPPPPWGLSAPSGIRPPGTTTGCSWAPARGRSTGSLCPSEAMRSV